jgi:hypothetical protein
LEIQKFKKENIMFEEKFDSLLGEYKTEIEGLERDVERFVKKRKAKITDIIGEEGPEEDAEEVGDILTGIRQYMLQLQNYMEEEVEQAASQASTKPEILEIFQYVIDKLIDTGKLFEDLEEIITKHERDDRLTQEFDTEDMYDITDPLNALIDKIDDDISEIERS